MQLLVFSHIDPTTCFSDLVLFFLILLCTLVRIPLRYWFCFLSW